jgi:hypothetical protein
MVRRLIAAALLLAGVVPAPVAAEESRVTLVLKFVKRAGASGPVARFDPASCAACRLVERPLFNADNPRETVVALTVPPRRTLELAFDGPPDGVRRVLLEGGEIPFRVDGTRTIVAVPPLASDAITAAEVATHIVEPGMVLRFEHADPARRAGAYATGRFPDVERRAANVLEFAQREVVRTLDLGGVAVRNGRGTIQIMGFDTNAPHGHVDAPPHIHMHLRWPGDTGTQIGHYYLTPAGLLSHNMVGIKGLPAPDRRFDRGATFTTIGPDGRPAYSHRITPEGWLEIARPGGATCLIRPVEAGGFAGGATVACGGSPVRRITVADDIGDGVLTVTTDDIVETFRYATDSGTLLSPTVPPAPPPSVPPVPPAER